MASINGLEHKNTKQLVAFSHAKPFEQRIVILKADGKPYSEIVAVLRDEFHKRWTESYVRSLFSAHGRLYQAYMEYNEWVATQSLKEAKQLAQRASKSAIITMVDLMKEIHDPTIRLGAAKAIANKYIPDRQVVVGVTGEEEELPDEIANAGDALLDELEGSDGSDQMDDTSQGEPAGQDSGAGGGEEVSTPVLPQPDSTDNASDTPT